MIFGGRYATTLLFLGDAVALVFSLWLTLLVRYLQLPHWSIFVFHSHSFLALFAIWVVVFYMAGLYSKRVLLFRNTLPGAIIRTQLLNVVIAALFFFTFPVGIAPKTNLVLYLGISVVLILFWRLWLFPRITKPSARESAALIGSGPDVDTLLTEVNSNARYHLSFPVHATPADLAYNFEEFCARLVKERVTLLVIDTEHDALRPFLPQLYELAFVAPGYQLSNLYEVYEEVFDRVPLSLLQYDWFIKNVSLDSSHFYEFLKRAIDIAGGLAMGLVTIISLPFIWLAMRLEGPGPLFISQARIGKFGTEVNAYKFRSMRLHKAASTEWTTEEKNDNPVTKVGAFMRTTSLDEFPQFMNILRGELSLIGPRNDIEGLGKRLAESIPYYNIRYIVKPGITGWAQINQQYEQGNISPQSIDETKTRLAYDFYYIKHRSLALDIVIALKTIKRMLFRVSTL